MGEPRAMRNLKLQIWDIKGLGNLISKICHAALAECNQHDNQLGAKLQEWRWTWLASGDIVLQSSQTTETPATLEPSSGKLCRLLSLEKVVNCKGIPQAAEHEHPRNLEDCRGGVQKS